MLKQTASAPQSQSELTALIYFQPLSSILAANIILEKLWELPMTWKSNRETDIVL